MVNDNCMITKGLMQTIREYVSSHKHVNRVLCVEAACRDIRLLNEGAKIPDDMLRQIICREAFRFGMVLHFEHDC